jgi:hypothetical protein
MEDTRISEMKRQKRRISSGPEIVYGEALWESLQLLVKLCRPADRYMTVVLIKVVN